MSERGIVFSQPIFWVVFFTPLRARMVCSKSVCMGSFACMRCVVRRQPFCPANEHCSVCRAGLC